MVSVTNLTKTYGSVNALNGVNVQVKESELFGVIGPDGAGKSTLFRIILSLLLPDSGEVEVWGFDPVKDYRKIRQMVGYMPGKFSLYEDLSVEENLGFFATVFGTTIKENYHLIKDIYQQIEPFKTRPAGKLSGGMKQKLALSCALIHKPKLLVLDEPTTGVDAVSRSEFWEMLQKLKKQGITILVSTPYMDEASLCDRVALIQKGKILDVAAPSEVVAGFDGKLFGVSGGNMYHLINACKSFEGVESVFPFGEELHLTFKDRDDHSEALMEFLRGKGFDKLNIRLIRPNIEDRFMSLMSSESFHE
ncbi:ABC transporter ATP-binding protein [Marinilabilia rubra]|uniref:ATPase n=1 Tax=Marinilabilia rubra TaxID=2162893 RepID=A0A2U2B3D0_9BACT|nr:ABC transporter ATP-binding protein [Marinilabilia rubra]PWD97571.1 ATPase [Marinilabilia rubra]